MGFLPCPGLFLYTFSGSRFPALLKQYLEQISVVGITFKYSENGVPVGLCRADRLFYVTTAGGNEVPDIFGFGYPVTAISANSSCLLFVVFLLSKDCELTNNLL